VIVTTLSLGFLVLYAFSGRMYSSDAQTHAKSIYKVLYNMTFYSDGKSM